MTTSSIVPIPPHEFKWDTTDVPLCQLTVQLVDLAYRHKLPVHQWVEDGLGDACGFFCELPSGLKVHAQELAHAVEYLGAQGPAIDVDASVLAKQGKARLIPEVLEGFDITPECLGWVRS